MEDQSNKIVEDYVEDVNKASEKTHLLSGQNTRINEETTADKTEKKVFESRFYLAIGTILIVFKGSEEMVAVTMKQFVYSWCLNQTATSNNLDHLNDSSVDNFTDACGHKGSKTIESQAQKLASSWELYFNLLNAVLVFVSVSTYGTLSDYFGRKPFFALALFGYAMRCGIIAVVIYFDLHIAWILLAFGIDGLGGSNYAVSLYTYACTADVTQRSGSRVIAIAIMEALLGVGKFSTEFGNGYYIHKYGYFYPVLTAGAGCFFSFLVTLLVFKETNRAVINFQQSEQLCSTFSSLISRYTSFYLKSGTKTDRTIFWLCLAVFVLIEMTFQGRSDPIVLYQLGSPFCWSSEEIGWYGTASVFLWYIVGCMLLKPLELCMSASTISCLGIVSTIAMFIVTGLAPSSLWIFIAIGFGLIMVVPKPILRALASTRALETEQGAMFAGLQSSELVCKMVSSPVSLSIYSASLNKMKGLVFLVLAGIDTLALIVMIYLSYVIKTQTNRPVVTVIQNTK